MTRKLFKIKRYKRSTYCNSCPSVEAHNYIVLFLWSGNEKELYLCDKCLTGFINDVKVESEKLKEVNK